MAQNGCWIFNRHSASEQRREGKRDGKEKQECLKEKGLTQYSVDGNLRRGRKCSSLTGLRRTTTELTAPTPEPNPTEEESKEQAASQSVGCLTLQCICPFVNSTDWEKPSRVAITVKKLNGFWQPHSPEMIKNCSSRSTIRKKPGR